MTKRGVRVVLISAVVASIAASVALAADLTVRGRRMVVRQSPDGGQTGRRILVIGRELQSGIASFDSPLVFGAVLRVFVAGVSEQSQLFVLDASGWSALGHGYRYVEPKNSGRAIRRVVLRADQSGGARVRVVLRGTDGNLNLAPPNPGSSGGIVLGLALGNTYCVQLGGSAGGKVAADTAAVWRIVAATGEPACPPVPTPLGAPTRSPDAATPTPIPCDTLCTTATPGLTPNDNPTACDTLGACTSSPQPTFEPPTPTPGPTPRSNPTACDTPGAGCPSPS